MVLNNSEAILPDFKGCFDARSIHQARNADIILPFSDNIL